MSHKGYLVAANISKYDRLLAQAEPDHAQSIVDDLLNTFPDDIRHTLVLPKLEGNSSFPSLPAGIFA